MKLLSTLTLSALMASTLFAQTTMCFKENHSSMSTIEKVTLDGGLCNSQKSVQDMKKNGWAIDDIKIDGKNYIYIFKKETNISNVNMEQLEQKIMQRLSDNKKEEQRLAKVQMRQKRSQSGKKLYQTKCQNCHGENGSSETGRSRDISSFDLAEFTTTIRDYNLGEYDRGTAFTMLPYANLMSTRDIKNVYVYLQSLKPENKDTKKEEAKK